MIRFVMIEIRLNKSGLKVVEGVVMCHLISIV